LFTVESKQPGKQEEYIIMTSLDGVEFGYGVIASKIGADFPRPPLVDVNGMITEHFVTSLGDNLQLEVDKIKDEAKAMKRSLTEEEKTAIDSLNTMIKLKFETDMKRFATFKQHDSAALSMIGQHSSVNTFKQSVILTGSRFIHFIVSTQLNFFLLTLKFACVCCNRGG